MASPEGCVRSHHLRGRKLVVVACGSCVWWRLCAVCARRVRESASARARGCERVREGERGCERARMREPETRGLVDLLEHQLVGSQVEVGRVK
eukprot:3938817-Rhodomonas_salina.2